MARPPHEVADLIRDHGKVFLETYPQPAHHLRTLQALAHCRTAALGGHMDQCDSCGHKQISYNSCRNRHCPKCQGLKQQQWVEAREADLLAVPYYHLVFTLPDKLNGLCLVNPSLLYNLLFQCAWQTMQTFAADHKYLGAQCAMIAVLHSWGQNLSLHPHIHAIVPGGGLTPQGKWKHGKGKGKFLFPVKAMSQVFRAKFVQGLRHIYRTKNLLFEGQTADLAQPGVFEVFCARLFHKPWVIYAKRPFAEPGQVLRYLGRYTHRIAISNHRIRSVKDATVSFSYKDYRKGGKKGLMTLTAPEFLRRFCLHILPPGFTKIRHYGFLAARNKPQALQLARSSLGMEPPKRQQNRSWKVLLEQATGLDLNSCPCCKKGRMITKTLLPPARSPPCPIPLPTPNHV